MKVEIHMVSPSSSLILWQNRGLIKVKSPKPQHGMNLGQFKQVLQLICSKWLCLYGEGRERPFKNGGSWLVQNGGEAAIAKVLNIWNSHLRNTLPTNQKEELSMQFSCCTGDRTPGPCIFQTCALPISYSSSLILFIYLFGCVLYVAKQMFCNNVSLSCKVGL